MPMDTGTLLMASSGMASLTLARPELHAAGWLAIAVAASGLHMRLHTTLLSSASTLTPHPPPACLEGPLEGSAAHVTRLPPNMRMLAVRQVGRPSCVRGCGGRPRQSLPAANRTTCASRTVRPEADAPVRCIAAEPLGSVARPASRGTKYATNCLQWAVGVRIARRDSSQHTASHADWTRRHSFQAERHGPGPAGAAWPGSAARAATLAAVDQPRSAEATLHRIGPPRGRCGLRKFLAGRRGRS